MRSLALTLTLLGASLPAILSPLPASAAGGHGGALEDADIDLRDKASLQRGVKYFTNYCMGCHSLQDVRCRRMANDLEIPEDVLREQLLVGDAKPTDMMTNAMRPEDGKKWFGTEIPDLTLVTRWRSPDWVYSYLKAFYVDDSRPYGVNNLVFPDVGMPHVLAPLQGVQEAVYDGDHHDGGTAHVVGTKLTEAGSLTPAEYDTMVRDLTNFLTYAGEPSQLQRRSLGIYVLLFLGLLFILTYYLKKEFWKDIH
jgi:ubiquinol-cytochrome c reductase cytochrome c1 subunit